MTEKRKRKDKPATEFVAPHSSHECALRMRDMQWGAIGPKAGVSFEDVSDNTRAFLVAESDSPAGVSGYLQSRGEDTTLVVIERVRVARFYTYAMAVTFGIAFLVLLLAVLSRNPRWLIVALLAAGCGGLLAFVPQWERNNLLRRIERVLGSSDG